MSITARTVVRCDYRPCGTEFVYDGNGSRARRAAVRAGWASGRSFNDMRKFADYCPEHVGSRAVSKVAG